MQQYDQRRLRLFAVVLFLGIMAANLGRYLIFDGLYLWDARLRWQECAYVLHGLNPFDVMHSRVPSIESIGWLDASLGGTVPWAYVLGNVINGNIFSTANSACRDGRCGCGAGRFRHSGGHIGFNKSRCHRIGGNIACGVLFGNAFR